jgi:glycosyltransferase involved in cell wall biosynthesis
LINAVACVHPEHPIKLLIAGEGIERTRLELLTRATGIQNAAHFVGQLSDMSAFWKATDLAVIPSEVTESFSMSTLESMACARPSLATLNGGIPELVVDGLTGALVPPGDVAALARAMVKYARQPELLPAHGAAARTRAIAHFHIDACAKAYLDLFAELSAASSLSCTCRAAPTRTTAI